MSGMCYHGCNYYLGQSLTHLQRLPEISKLCFTCANRSVVCTARYVCCTITFRTHPHNIDSTIECFMSLLSDNTMLDTVKVRKSFKDAIDLYLAASHWFWSVHAPMSMSVLMMLQSVL
jgi:hypothetical protein